MDLFENTDGILGSGCPVCPPSQDAGFLVTLGHPGPMQMSFFAFLSLPSGFAFLKFPVYKVMCHVLSGVGRSSLHAWFEFTHVAVCASDALTVLSSIARLDTPCVHPFVVGHFLLLTVTIDTVTSVPLPSCGHVRGYGSPPA